jgi:serine/threonine protein kinase
MDVPDEFLEWAATLALEMRRRVKEAQAFIGAAEFGKVDLSYSAGDGPDTVVYCDESVKHRMRMENEAEARSADSQTADGEVLPAPDPRDVSSKTPARDYAAGDTIGARFEVEEVLGSGGFSKVYRVRDVVEGEERALKLFDNAAGYDAVRREISALRKVHHPNVVKVIWADRTDAGEWYLIMEYIEGELLAEYATGKKQLRDREAIDVALDVLSALTAIHPDSERLDALDQKKRDGEITGEEYDELMSLSENALVHRDIKPQNIMLTRSGAKLLDFNIASRVGDPVRTVSGTPPYQPPDADLTRWDVSTDLFAVGVTLYELLCDGQHPYPQARPTLDVEPRDPRQFRKDLNDQLADFLTRACASERSTRFQTAAEMKAALESARASL